MYIFVDESGDLGFNLKYHKCSRKFVICALVCDNRQAALKVSNAARKTLENKINKPKKSRIVTELKGYATSFEVKQYFYSHAQKSKEWQLFSIILDKKEALKALNNKLDKDRLYSILVHELLKEIDFEGVKTVNLVIDKSKDSQGVKDFDDYLKLNLGLVLPLKISLSITHEDSCKNKGLQAVDMFCHGIFTKYEAKNMNWYNLFKSYVQLEKKYRA